MAFPLAVPHAINAEKWRTKLPRQHAAPLLIPSGQSLGTTLERVETNSEADVQELVHNHPEILPIAEIDPSFLGLVPVCRELNTPAGPVDNFMITPSGLPVLIECKLWRNPQARREVVGQALDYAKELTRWTSADIEREAKRRGVDNLFLKVCAGTPEANEADFHDALSANLARGRCLLLIVGDGIREGVEAIFEHLRQQAALHFSLGLVELPVFELPDGSRLVLPRVLARTALEIRQVIELPVGLALQEIGEDQDNRVDPETQALGDERKAFWAEFLVGLQLDDPDQPIPQPPRQGYISIMLPAPSGSSWINVYREIDKGLVGLSLSSKRDTIGKRANDLCLDNLEEYLVELGGDSKVNETNGRRTLGESKHFGDLSDPDVRMQAFDWLAERANAYVNVFRPAVRSAVADLEATDD